MGRGAGAGRPGCGGKRPREKRRCPALLPEGAPLAHGERVEGGSGEGRGGKLSQRGSRGRVVGLPGSRRSGVPAPVGGGGGWSLDSGLGGRAEK